MNAQVILPLEDLLQILEAARRVPALEAELEKLQSSYEGLRMLYSEILEALRR